MNSDIYFTPEDIMDLLQKIKSHAWFYEFLLPDGSKTESYLSPQVAKIHITREKALRNFLQQHDYSNKSALDISCHEGFFSLILSEYFNEVSGIDKNASSLELAQQMSLFLKKKNITFKNISIEDAEYKQFDFVLCYGLIYHIENPLHVIRKISSLTKKTLCIETQILPFSMTCQIEDGYYMNQRPLQGVFGLCHDYPASKEGGLTEYALVPDLNAIIYLLKEFNFNSIEIYKPDNDDYEQFVRGSRVIIFAQK